MEAYKEGKGPSSTGPACLVQHLPLLRLRSAAAHGSQKALVQEKLELLRRDSFREQHHERTLETGLLFLLRVLWLCKSITRRSVSRGLPWSQQ